MAPSGGWVARFRRRLTTRDGAGDGDLADAAGAAATDDAVPPAAPPRHAAPGHAPRPHARSPPGSGSDDSDLARGASLASSSRCSHSEASLRDARPSSDSVLPKPLMGAEADKLAAALGSLRPPSVPGGLPPAAARLAAPPAPAAARPPLPPGPVTPTRPAAPGPPPGGGMAQFAAAARSSFDGHADDSPAPSPELGAGGGGTCLMAAEEEDDRGVVGGGGAQGGALEASGAQPPPPPTAPPPPSQTPPLSGPPSSAHTPDKAAPKAAAASSPSERGPSIDSGYRTSGESTRSSAVPSSRSSFAVEGASADVRSAWPAPGAPLLPRPRARVAADVLSAAGVPTPLWPAAAALALLPAEAPLPMSLLQRLWASADAAGAEATARALAAAGAAKVAHLADGSAWALAGAELHANLVAALDGGAPADHAALLDAYAVEVEGGDDDSVHGAGADASFAAAAAARAAAASPHHTGTTTPPTANLAAARRRARRLAAAPDDGYLVHNAGHHLAAARDGPALACLLADADWLDAKLRSYGVAAVTADFRRALAAGLLDRTTADGVRLSLAAFQMSAPAAVAAPGAGGVLRAQMAARLAHAPGVLAPPCPAVTAAHTHGDPPRAVGLRPLGPTLHGAGGAARLTLRGHSGAVTKVVVAPNGVDAYTASADGSVRVYDLEVGDCVLRLACHAGPVADVCADGAGRLLLTAGADGRARVWDLAGGKCVRELAGHVGPIHAAALDARGRLALTAGADGCLKAWDVERGEVAATLCGHGSAGVRCLALSPDGRTAVTGGEDFRAVAWDLGGGAGATALAGHAGWVVGIALTADAGHALTASHDATCRVWRLASGECERVLAGHSGRLSAVRLAADGGTALTASDDGTARVWDWRTGACARVLDAHDGWLADAALVAGGPDPPPRAVALTASADGLATAWDVQTGVKLASLRGHAGAVACAALTRRGRFAVTGGADGTARVWDLDAHPPPPPPGHVGGVLCLACVASDGGARAYVSVADDGVRVWCPADGAPQRPLAGGDAPARWVRASGGVVLTASPDAGLRAWAGPGLAPLPTLSGRPGSRVRAFDAAPGVRGALFAAYDSSVWVVRLVGEGDGASWITIPLQTRGGALANGGGRGHAGVTAARLSADATTAVTAAVDGSVRVWDAATGACLHALDAHGDAVCCATLSADGGALLTVAEDGGAAWWDARTGALAARLAPGMRWAGGRLSPDGAAAVVWGAGGASAQLWRAGGVDRPGPACVADLDAPAGGVSAAAWSSAGTAVALASPDGTLRIYRTGPGADGSMAAFFMADTRLTAAAFAPEASLGGPPSLAAGCDDGIVHVISLDAVDWMA